MMNIKITLSLITLSISLISGLPTNSNSYPVNSSDDPIAEYYPDDSIYGSLDSNPWDFVGQTTTNSNNNDKVQAKPNPIISQDTQTKPNAIPQDAQAKPNTSIPADVQTKPSPIEEDSQTDSPKIESSEGADINEQKNTRKPLRRQYDFDNDPQFNGQKVNGDTFWSAAKTVPSILGWVSKM